MSLDIKKLDELHALHLRWAEEHVRRQGRAKLLLSIFFGICAIVIGATVVLFTLGVPGIELAPLDDRSFFTLYLLGFAIAAFTILLALFASTTAGLIKTSKRLMDVFYRLGALSTKN